jgi:phage-related protein
MSTYNVTVYSIQGNSVVKDVKAFESIGRANDFMTEEMKWEGTVRVVCKELGVDVDGDYVGVSHTFEGVQR